MLYPELTPASATEPHLNHQHLGEALDGRRSAAERRELLGKLDAELAATSAEVVVLSYERFWLAEAWRRLPRVLADLCARRGFRPEILVTVRPQAELIQSQYGWRVQFMREARSFARAFRRDLAGPRLDIDAGLALWARAAEGRVTAVPLRHAHADSHLTTRIAAALDLSDRLGPPVGEATERRENVSPGPVTTEVSRRLRQAGVRADASTRRRMVARIAELARDLPEDQEPFRALTPALAAMASQRFAGSNASLARRLWACEWDSHVACTPPGEVTELADRVLPGVLERALGDIAATVRAEHRV